MSEAEEEPGSSGKHTAAHTWRGPTRPRRGQVSGEKQLPELREDVEMCEFHPVTVERLH